MQEVNKLCLNGLKIVDIILLTPGYCISNRVSKITKIKMCFQMSMQIPRKPQQTNEAPQWSRSSQSSQQMPSRSKISPCALYNSFCFRQPQRALQPSTKQQQREAASLSKVLQPSSFTMPFATTSGGYRVIQRKLCPWWRRTDVIKAVSCCRARKPSPTTWNYLNHAPASRKGG